MITIYTTPSCAGCRKAKKWFEEKKIEYVEKNLFTHKITEHDIDLMLENSENGFDDIISTRSKVFQEENLNIYDMTVSELKKFIIENPSVLRRPIIIEDNKLQVGYDDDEITIFTPKRLREIIEHYECSNDDRCDYLKCLKQYLAEIDQK